MKERYHIDGKENVQPRAEFMNEVSRSVFLKGNEGFNAMDLDAVVSNYRTQKLLLIEDKCFRAEPSKAQQKTLEHLWQMLKDSRDFAGVYLLQHENTSSYSGYNLLSYFDGTDWKYVPSGSYNNAYKMTGDDLFRYIRRILDT